MDMKDINWLDGKSADGKHILQFDYINGGVAFLKNSNYEKLVDYVRIMSDCKEVVQMTIFDPAGNPVFSHCKPAFYNKVA